VPSWIERWYAWRAAREGRASPGPAAVEGERSDAKSPRFETWMAAGRACLEREELSGALVNFQHAVDELPSSIAARVNLGFVLLELGHSADAVEFLRVAVTQVPPSADAHYLLGTAYLRLGNSSAAVPCLEAAVALQPSLAQGHRDLGKALFDAGRITEAQDAFARGLEIFPNSFELHFFMGNLLAEAQRFESALVSYKHALALEPMAAAVHSNMVPALINRGDFAQATTAARRALELDPGLLNARSNLLMAMSRDRDCTAQSYLSEAQAFGLAVLAQLAARRSRESGIQQPTPVASATAAGPGREKPQLRVGMISGDLRRHPVGYFLDQVLAHWDHEEMHLSLYANQLGADSLTATLRRSADRWTPVHALDDRQLHTLIAADGIDILVDLSGHTPRHRLSVFAARAAAVQVTWLGYWATTGVLAMDYLLASPVCAPASSQHLFTETLWHLPSTRLCFSPPVSAPNVSALPALKNGTFVFGSFQSLVKVNASVLRLWALVLSAVPGAMLRLQSLQLSDPADDLALRTRLQCAGIDLSRVSLVAPGSYSRYLADHAHVDVILDTFPHAAATTTCEALWMGVPTITLAGESLLSRQGASLLTACGLMDWIACSEQQYLDIAVRQANNLAGLAQLRAGLRERLRASPVCDAEEFARDLQSAFQAMWQAQKVMSQ